ncbi:MAG: ABC transporter permease subunit [Chloroflexi bacterium]|nr:ABC transporter permease subunit [Chloroflexota bacterium]
MRLTIPLIAGIAGAFALSSVGTSLTLDGLKKLDTTSAHVLGGVLGAIAGAIVMALVGLIGMQAAWLGLLPPFAAASLASGLLPGLYRRLTGTTPRTANRSIVTALSWIGSIAAFVLTAALLRVDQAVIAGTLPSQEPAVNLLGMGIPLYIAETLLIGAVLGGIMGALSGTKAAFPLGEILYNITRTVLNALRSIEPLIMGLVFVIWVGIGPFAGVLALTLHSIASLGKLYSEQIESIDTGPIEALQSTGANWIQTIMYAVVPQIIPPYIAFTMYRWDINVRMSTIIGFVGGGGVGFLLQQQINLLRYRDAGVAVLAIAIVVSILDYASASIRERVI